MYHTLLEGVWLSGIERMAEVRNVPHLAARCGTFTLLHSLGNEYKLRTHTSNVRYISFQRNLQLKIHLSSYDAWMVLRLSQANDRFCL